MNQAHLPPPRLTVRAPPRRQGCRGLRFVMNDTRYTTTNSNTRRFTNERILA
jgi:hypothetical protein